MDPQDERPLFSADERFTLDPASPVPLYHQIEKVILDRLAGGAVGKKLPAEKELMVMFDVSRATARKTYEGLVTKGIIERRRALGTRVIGTGITEDLGRLKSFSEEMRLKGLTICNRLLGTGRHVPDERIADKLDLQPGEETCFIRRLRGSSEVFPIVLLTSEIPAKYGIDPAEDFGGSLYQLIEERHRIPIEWAEEEIKVEKASAEEAAHLGIAPGDGVLVMERTTYTREEKPLEFVRGVYRPEHYTFAIRLRR